MTNIISSELSSLGYLLECVERKPIEYSEEKISYIRNMDMMLEKYTDDLSISFQKMLVNKRALQQAEFENNMYVINNREQKLIIFNLQTNLLNKHIVNHTKRYGKNTGYSFKEILDQKLRQKLDHISTFVQNEIILNNHSITASSIFNLYTYYVDYDSYFVVKAVISKIIT